KKQLAETEKAINNMINAIEQGIITSSTKDRLQELEQTKDNLQINLAREEIKKPVLEKEQIIFWLLKLRKLDMTKEDDRQILIDNFVNSIYLYDDRIIFIFNYKSEAQIVNLADIDCSDICEPTAPKILFGYAGQDFFCSKKELNVAKRDNLYIQRRNCSPQHLHKSI
ncbi:MAG: hypothetical protein RR395_09340, partial [Ruthenibacterium sp.]